MKKIALLTLLTAFSSTARATPETDFIETKVQEMVTKVPEDNRTNPLPRADQSEPVNDYLLENWMPEDGHDKHALAKGKIRDRLFVVVHQHDSLAAKTPALLKRLKMPVLGLASETYPMLSKKLQSSVTLLQYSNAGEINLPINAKEIHLAGGFVTICFAESVRSVVELATKENDVIRLVIHADLTYLELDSGDQMRTLADFFAKRLPKNFALDMLDDPQDLSAEALAKIHRHWFSLEMTAKPRTIRLAGKKRQLLISTKAENGKAVEILYNYTR